MIELPEDLPIVEHDVVRMVVRDATNRILLFHTGEQSESHRFLSTAATLTDNTDSA